MSDEKITYLNRGKKTLEDDLLDIANSIREDAEAQSPTSADKSSTFINGNNNIIGSGNTVHNVITISRPARRVIQVKTGDGVIDAEQKHSIKTMLYDWVSMHNAVKKSLLTHQSAWILLNKYMKVSSYHEIKQDDFNKALKWLRAKIGTLRNMASAPKKIDDWRSQTIKSIQARCSEKGWQTWRKEHMLKKFGKQSMKDLTDSELKQLYQTVWNKK
ncbi:hypothetical protein ACTP12_14930 [Klebsiella michiganensis]|uniref:hypothetical protein n=1 Tax=Klebsiella TaxID=570 RepID=UPI000E2B259F|nr:hypothetical protein [Klebsiella pneumoniae]SVU50916.1 Uncharacterised protein [Klebsiella pneumoniae]SVV35587.1 Uncharacterised protein [Klebsiella pneumoniae]